MTPSAPSTTPIPKQPIGATFVVAMCVLGFFLILQFLAVVWYFLPKLRQAVVESATVSNVQPAAGSASAQPATQNGSAQASAVQPQQDQEMVLRISKLVADSDRAYRVGDFETAMKGIDEADALLPDDPGILLRRARLLEGMQLPAEAAAVYERVAALPGLSPELRSQAEKKLSALGGAPAAKPAAKPEQTFAENAGGADVRDEIGLQPGSSLGIVDSRLRDGNPGTKVLRIAIKSRPGTSVDTRQMKLHVFFYEKDETGETQLTDSKVVSQWISPPVNWQDNEPELLDVTYTLPDASQGGRQFVGYIVGIYYNAELQDTRSDPGPLVKKFPLPLYLKQEAQ